MARKPLRIDGCARRGSGVDAACRRRWLMLRAVCGILVTRLGWQRLRQLQRGCRVAKIRHAALQIGAPSEQLVDPGCHCLLGLSVGVHGGLDLGLELGEEGRNGRIHGFQQRTALAQAPGLDEMR